MADAFNDPTRKVVVLGASPKPDRYAFKAMRMLLAHGFDAVPVNPAFREILSRTCYRSIAEVPVPIDTITMYLSSKRSEALVEEIIHSKPQRIVFNPGAENARLEYEAAKHGIKTIHGCTLIMLQSGEF